MSLQLPHAFFHAISNGRFLMCLWVGLAGVVFMILGRGAQLVGWWIYEIHGVAAYRIFQNSDMNNFSFENVDFHFFAYKHTSWYACFLAMAGLNVLY